MPYLLIELFHIGMPVVRTDGRAYGHVITKFSRMGRLPHFPTHGAPLARFAPQSSAIINLALPITNYKFPLKFLEQSSGVLSNCIFVNGKQPCSPSWQFRTIPMTSCNGSIFHLPRLLDFLHCCSLQMWAQRWVYRARRIQ